MLPVLATALASPEFLYVTQRGPAALESPDKINDFEFVTRLSIFLWSSVPDEQLLDLAEKGTIRDPKILSAQIKRLLTDIRSKRFSKNFVHQWLGLDGLDNATHISEPELRDAMQKEPIAFFEEILKHNRSILDFIHSDFAMVNERLADHYKFPKIHGTQFRRVPIEPRNHRGGLLTASAILAMNSDGKDSHPLKRGVWMLERILHAPPPPPPPNVPEVDLTNPEILKMTLKERIADHRNHPACLSCHSRIDPWGIAFENFDAFGVYRTHIKNKPVDSSSKLFNQHTLTGMNGLKRYLLSDRQDQFARAMVHKMTAYGLGRTLSFSDHAALDRLTAQLRQKGDGLVDLLNLIINSKIFNSR
ncbi:MAG: DUF1592 domain-containing protein [Planctomycetota bacterium]|nr:DUF1592 domain-containing protein [Planctomycetota bacterium]